MEASPPPPLLPWLVRAWAILEIAIGGIGWALILLMVMVEVIRPAEGNCADCGTAGLTLLFLLGPLATGALFGGIGLRRRWRFAPVWALLPLLTAGGFVLAIMAFK